MGKLGAFGTEFQMYVTDAYVTIANVAGIGGPGLTLDTEDVTTHDSTEAWEEVVATVLRTGEVNLDLVYDPADDTVDATAGLVDLLETKELGDFNIVFPDHPTHTTWHFHGYVTGFEPDAPHDGALTASVTLKITGKPTLV